MNKSEITNSPFKITFPLDVELMWLRGHIRRYHFGVVKVQIGKAHLQIYAFRRLDEDSKPKN